MEILRKSQYSGNLYTMNLPVTEEQIRKFESGQSLIQDIFPDLTPDQREFIKTGIINEEWEELFGPNENWK